MSDPSPFDQLLAAAAAQADPQQLLFVFAGAGLPADATPDQRMSFEQGMGGELTPLMCADKPLGEMSSFEALVAESRDKGPAWHVMFAAGLSGRDGAGPARHEIEAALTKMVERVNNGHVDGLLALSSRGDALDFH